MDADANNNATGAESEGLWVPMPSRTAPLPATYQLTSLVCSERDMGRLVETLLARAGLSISEAARRLHCDHNAISQYINGRRTRPSLLWFLKIATLCGARVLLEFAPRRSAE